MVHILDRRQGPSSTLSSCPTFPCNAPFTFASCTVRAGPCHPCAPYFARPCPASSFQLATSSILSLRQNNRFVRTKIPINEILPLKYERKRSEKRTPCEHLVCRVAATSSYVGRLVWKQQIVYKKIAPALDDCFRLLLDYEITLDLLLRSQVFTTNPEL